MAWTLSDHDSGRAQTKEAAGGGSNDVRVRVYRTRQIFHQIWFEENRLASHVQTEQPQSVHQEGLDLFRVFGCIQNRYK
jgi:hypothetical protein